MNRTTLVLAAVAIFATAGCSKKELIAQKDVKILELQGDDRRSCKRTSTSRSG